MIVRYKSSEPQLPANRTFGWFFAIVLALVSAYFYWKTWSEIAIFAFILSSIFASITLLSPQLLEPINRFWYFLVVIMGNIMSPIILGIIFFVLITPTAIIARLLGRDELKIKKRNMDSYWIPRSPPGPPSDSFKNQY
jgi:hypothetical protein